MRPLPTFALGALLALAAALPPRVTTSAPVDSSAVRVVVEKGRPRSGGFAYRYLVINNAVSPITGLMVGFDGDAGRAEFLTAPLGWNGIEVPPENMLAPAGWRAYVTRTEEDSVINLAWDNVSPGRAIFTESRLAGFAVRLANEDSLYESGHWTVTFSGGPVASLTGRLWRVRVVTDSTRHDSASAGRWKPLNVPDDPSILVRRDPTWTSATIDFDMENPGPAEVVILGPGGETVKTLFHQEAHAGRNTVKWKGTDDRGLAVMPGTYTVRVRSAGTERFARLGWLR
jgi:hypothetical protein